MSKKSTPTADRAAIAEYEAALHTMLDENEALKAEVAELKGQISTLVDWINGDAPDALATLQQLYLNPEEPTTNRLKAAVGALPFEKPRLASTEHVVVSFYDRVRAARLKSQAKRLEEAKLIEGKVIEHDPDAPAAS